MGIMGTVREIVDAIYEAEDNKGRNLTRLRPVEYQDTPGITSCFVCRGSPAEPPSPAFQQLNELAAALNDRIRAEIVPQLPGWRYATHVPHMTAAAVIDPLQQQTIPSGAAESLLWTTLVRSFAVLADSLEPFEVSFFRLFIAGNGTVVVVEKIKRVEDKGVKSLLLSQLYCC